MSQITSFRLPDSMAGHVHEMWKSLGPLQADAMEDLGEEQLESLYFVWACSTFVAQACQRDPGLLEDLINSGDLVTRYVETTYVEKVTQALCDAQDETALSSVLRKLRQREMVRIAWRDIAGWAELEETTNDLSALADACIDGALGILHSWLCGEFGQPFNAKDELQQMVVLGMGKLGACELNYSSDVDLIFAYPEGGETRGGRRTLSNEEFFRRLGQKLIAALDQKTAEGFVFRVDMRLRPFGDSGSLAMSFDAMEDYYQLHGREWERYAMVKVRVVAGDKQAGQRLMQILHPFVYRRYLDYGAFDALREMKKLISNEVQRKGMENNIKLGPGGIREVEFIGQAFQLIRGGREPVLQERRIIKVLESLKQLNYLPEYVVNDLIDAYVFLRHSEHRLQEYLDQQTHDLPEDDEGKLRQATAMGFKDWAAYEAVLRNHMAKVHSHFNQVFEAPQTDSHEAAETFTLGDVWKNSLDDSAALTVVREVGFDDPEQVLATLSQLRETHNFRIMGRQGQERMDKLVPLVLGAVGSISQSTTTLGRLFALLETIARRTAYVSLLLENPVALSQLVKLCAVSSWISHLLTRHPLLLDELLDPRMLYNPPERSRLCKELNQRLSVIDEQDLEQQMEVLRQFKQSNVLRVAAADIMGVLPIMKVSDHLTWIAEVIVEKVLALAWAQMVSRYGQPIAVIADEKQLQGFAVVAYGKMGGLELGYSSDLDLVFLHDDGAGETDGDKSVDNAVFFARLAQRIIHLLTTHTPSGVLYEIDLRLRPSGASGLLVSSTRAFAEYQRNEAWTWEHQALIRARAVTGDVAVAEMFGAIRQEILCNRREQGQLGKDVREMRERMRGELASKKEGIFDLKQGLGGIADIEFMVQYGVLVWASQYQELCRYTDNIRILEQFAALGLIAQADADVLIDAYQAYRANVHRLSLQDAKAEVADTDFKDFRDEVTRVWQAMLAC